MNVTDYGGSLKRDINRAVGELLNDRFVYCYCELHGKHNGCILIQSAIDR